MKANACPRCLTIFASTDKEDGEIHTCTPTQAWRDLEAKNAKLREALEAAEAELSDALERACKRVQDDLFPIDNPRGRHRFSTHFSEVRAAILGDRES